jgi:hypothetical protein
MPAAAWFNRYGGVMRLVDSRGRPVILLAGEWAADRIERENSALRLLRAAELDGGARTGQNL